MSLDCHELSVTSQELMRDDIGNTYKSAESWEMPMAMVRYVTIRITNGNEGSVLLPLLTPLLLCLLLPVMFPG